MVPVKSPPNNLPIIPQTAAPSPATLPPECPQSLPVFHPTFKLINFMGPTSLPAFLLLALCCLCTATDPPVALTDVNCTDYDGFLTLCQRTKSDNATVYEKRRAVFESNCQQVNDNNARYARNESSYQSQLYCAFSDVPEEQKASEVGLAPVKFAGERQTSLPEEMNRKVAATVLPTTLNYVTKGYVTSVKNQGSCGCCWSFASIAMYESQLLMRGFSYGLSEEASLECTSYYSPNKRVSDCSGGYFVDPLTFLAKVGTVLRSTYPYIAGSFGSIAGYPYTPGICNETQRIMVGNGTSTTYGPLSQTQVKTMLNSYGPVMVGVYANTAFTQYSGGVFSGCPVDAANYINHAVLLVGYNDNDRSWLVKNQWASGWGESGYIRVSYNNDCGISSLLGNVVFSSYNANPSITVTSSMLFNNSKWEGTVSALLAMLILTALLVL